ncbi:cation:proton antiporter [Dactylosporangium sp. NPDC050688]|uniref:cation:proton antiporter n=1 Tax=Dactylosporangium sp. NPDC050688 TaxID=3157217 RepID=UPI0033DAC1BA
MNAPTRHRVISAYLVFAAVVVAAGAALIVALSRAGEQDGFHAAAVPGGPSGGPDVPHILAVLAVLVAAAHLGGSVAARLRQPRVIGQATVGLLLGPSALGQVAPAAAGWLQSGGAVAAVEVLAQLGVLLFVFCIGHHLTGSTSSVGRGAALLTGHITVVVPLFGGVAVGLTVLTPPPGIATLPHALFVGLAMSATALPVLAHILTERRLLTSPLGALATTAAAVADATIWALLVVTLCLARGGSLAATGLRLAAAAGFVAVLWWLLRPLARRMLAADHAASPLRPALLLCAVLGCAAATERLGLHAIIGAFLAGLALPREAPAVRRVVVVAGGAAEWLLLPLFFVAVAAHTRLDLLVTGPVVAVAALVLAAAVAGKLLSGIAAGRVIGLAWRDASTLGVLLNCRGVTELVLLNLGRTAGIIDETTFTVFVVMAVLTTAGTGPLLDLLGAGHTPRGDAPVPPGAVSTSAGPALDRVAEAA